MRTLADLFDDRRSTEEPAHGAERADDRARFEALVGPPRAHSRRGTPRDDTMALVTMVDRAARSASPTRAAGTAGKVVLPKRGAKRVDWLNVSVAVLAVGLVTSVAVYGGIQLANSTPAASAVRALSVDEATLVNSEAAAVASIERIDELVAEAQARADAVEPALAALRDYVDEDTRRRAVEALEALREQLDAIELPAAPVTYARPDIDTEDLAAVGAQIDAVRERADGLDGVNEQIRETRERVSALREDFDAAIVALGSALPAAAEVEVQENIEADETFIDAVIEGADSVVRRQEEGATASDEMAAFPGLVDALREDHARVIAEILAEQERLAEIERQNNLGNGGGFVPAPSDPGTGVEPDPAPTDPTDPVDPDPEPTDPPEPADPEPTEPAEPPVDGGTTPDDGAVG